MRGKYEGGAIPIRFFLNPYRVISDTYGVFVFDPDAGFSRGYEPSLDFKFYGWRNGIAVMRHKDGTLFSTLSGRAFDGPRKGEQLKPIPTLTTNWGYWNKSYPGSVAYLFTRKGVVTLDKGGQSEDDVLTAVLDAGAEEVNDLGESFEVVSEPGDLVAVRTALQEAGIDYDSAEADFRASVEVPVDLSLIHI